MIDHTLDDAMDRVQEVGVLTHGQQRTDLGVQKIMPVAETHTVIHALYHITHKNMKI